MANEQKLSQDEVTELHKRVRLNLVEIGAADVFDPDKISPDKEILDLLRDEAGEALNLAKLVAKTDGLHDILFSNTGPYKEYRVAIKELAKDKGATKLTQFFAEKEAELEPERRVNEDSDLGLLYLPDRRTSRAAIKELAQDKKTAELAKVAIEKGFSVVGLSKPEARQDRDGLKVIAASEKASKEFKEYKGEIGTYGELLTRYAHYGNEIEQAGLSVSEVNELSQKDFSAKIAEVMDTDITSTEVADKGAGGKANEK